jgi:hypothetical protein
MAFIPINLLILTNPVNINTCAFRSYVTQTDSLATVKAANYFIGSKVTIGDIITCKASDDVGVVQVNTLTTNGAGIATAVTVKSY